MTPFSIVSAIGSRSDSAVGSRASDSQLHGRWRGVRKRPGVHARHPRFAAERQQYQSLGRPSAALAAMGHPRIDARGRVSPLLRSRAAEGGPRPEPWEEFAFRLARPTDLGRRVAAVALTLCPRLRLCCRSAAKRGESIAPRRIHERIGGRVILPNVITSPGLTMPSNMLADRK